MKYLASTIRLIPVKYLEAIILSILSIFLPIKAMMIASATLILADLILGILASHKQGHKITSAGLRRTLSKLIIYEIGLLLGYVAETYLLSNLLPISKIIAGMIGIVELKSVFENLDLILGQSFFKLVINKIGSENQVLDKIKQYEDK